jgi:hypothetical protein
VAANPGAAPAARVIADTHVHLYPCHDTALALASLAANLAAGAAAAGAGTAAALFAERRDCRLFAKLRSGELRPAHGPFTVRAGAEPGTALLLEGGRPVAHLFDGRQIVTAERVEILALAASVEIPDGLPADRVVAAILDAGGVPAVGWSPGKWWFARGAVIGALLRGRRPGELLLGDTALRPARSPEPSLMRAARRAGFAVVAGTDALPLAGEERLLGSYGTLFAGAFDDARPLASIRELLRSPAAVAGTAGSRGTWAGAARRWLGNARGATPCAA